MNKHLVFLALASFAMTGCAGLNARREFAKGAEVYTLQILPEYKDYIANDLKLEEDTKRIRTQTADEFDRYIQNGVK